jgi:NAD(P)-dependent dehydrogenase (short-subunit alcohol dehydrogenase family)
LVVRGFHVFIGARNADAGLKLAQALTRSGGKATFLKIDVADADGVLTAAREYERLEDHLDVLVNNAGILLEGDSA